MIRCIRTVEVTPLHWEKCGGKVMEDITFYDDESRFHGIVLSCLHCGDETILSLRRWKEFKKKLESEIVRVRFSNKSKSQQALPAA